MALAKRRKPASSALTDSACILRLTSRWDSARASTCVNHESSIQMSNIAPIGFSLSTTAAWGAANFLGGYASRRVNPFVLATIADLSGLAFMILVATTVHAPIPSKHALTWSLVAGTAGGLALAIFWITIKRKNGIGGTSGWRPFRGHTRDCDHVSRRLARRITVDRLCAGDSRSLVDLPLR
jgi:hypothetical protein